MAVAYNRKSLVDAAQLTTSAATYYTTPANTKCDITKFTFTNTSSSAVTVTAHLIPSGGTASDTNTVSKTHTLAPAGSSGDTWLCPQAVGHVLNAGGFIQALCSSATSVSFRATGTEIVG